MSQSRTQLQNVQRRLYHYLTPEVAACAGLRFDELSQVCIGTLIPTPEQLNILSRRMSLPQYPNTKAHA
jgi:hypothetical protein